MKQGEDLTNWPLVWLLWAAGLGAAAQYGKISVIFDKLPEIYPEAGAMLGFAVSLVGLVGIVLGVVAGVLVARIGYRRALLAALVGGALISALQALWPQLPVFLALRVAEGAAHLAIVVAAPTLIAEVTAAKDQGRALTLWGSFFGVAFAVLAFAGLPLAEVFGLGALMLAHAGFMGLMALLLWARLPRVDRAPKALSLAEVLRAHLTIYRSARIGAPAFGWLFYTICFVSLLTVLPPFIASEWRALVLTAMPLLSIVTSLTLGVLLLRWVSAVSVVLLGFGLCALCSVAMLLSAGSAMGPALAALAIGASLGLVQGATFASVPQLNSAAEHRALANGGLAQMGNLGNTSGTPLLLAILSGFGFAGMVWVLILLFLLGAAAHLFCSFQRTR